jgi:hypothetical protein
MRLRYGVATTLTLALAAALALPARASTDRPCGLGCFSELKACAQSARTGMMSCKMNCRQNSSPDAIGACVLGCRGTLHSDKTSCRSGLSDCFDSCAPPSLPPPPPDGCVAGCGQTLATCAQGVVTQLKMCLEGCRTAADHLSCLFGCTSDARQGGGACATDFRTCLSGCGFQPPPIPCLFSGPACGGSCPMGLVCQPTTGRMFPLACLCRRPSSPSGAFVDAAPGF